MLFRKEFLLKLPHEQVGKIGGKPPPHCGPPYLFKNGALKAKYSENEVDLFQVKIPFGLMASRDLYSKHHIYTECPVNKVQLCLRTS